MPFPGWGTELCLLPRLTRLIEGTWILPGGSVSTYWQWYHLSALAVISCLIDFCLVILPASSLSQAPLLCISLPSPYWLIDSSIHLLQGGWQAGIWLFCLSAVLQPEGWLPEVPGVLPKEPVCKPLLPTIPRGATNSFFFWQVMESLTNLHLHVLRCKRELLFDLVSAWDCFPKFCLWELSDCCTNTALFFPRYPSRDKQLQGCEPIPLGFVQYQSHVRGALTRVFGTEGKKKTNSLY